MADHESRVSQGGEGRLRRVTPEENRRLVLTALREGRCDVDRQAGWNLAVEEIAAFVDDKSGSMLANWIRREFGSNG